MKSFHRSHLGIRIKANKGSGNACGWLLVPRAR